jgi:hypothetical protein
LDYFFDISIPFAAGRTLTDPFGALGATVLAEKRGFGFSHF